MVAQLQFDRVGYWSQVKLEIVRDYAHAYSTILVKQPALTHVYVDAFAGAGMHELKATGKLIPGSPLNALAVDPPFKEVHLIDLDQTRVQHLKQLVGDRKDVFVHEGDCNTILLRKVFPRIRYEDYRRGLCLLDPYGLTLNWEVIMAASKMRSIEIFLNFSIMDMNRNALWTDPSGIAAEDLDRMTSFWGDQSWRNIVYRGQLNFDGGEDLVKVATNPEVATAFRTRLRNVAGFKEVPEPIPMRNSKNATVYYLFFASHNAKGAKIARHIMKKYANHMEL
jgi:three-Cys-motif partner protein